MEQPEVLRELDDLELSMVAGGGMGGVAREVVINPTLMNN
jgi:hypothetical protein